MRTIAFVTQKGGSGKSTLASSLAVAAQEMKEKVCVVDMDPQGSLTNWLKTRGADDIEVVASGRRAAAGRPGAAESQGLHARDHRHARRGGSGFGGRDGRRRPQHHPVAAEHVRPVGERQDPRGAQGGRRRVRVPAQSMPAGSADGARQGRRGDARRNGRSHLAAHSRRASTIRKPRAMGSGVTELNPGGAAAEEMRALWVSVRRRLAEAKPRTAAPQGGVTWREAPPPRASRQDAPRRPAFFCPLHPPSRVRIVSPPRWIVRSHHRARSAQALSRSRVVPIFAPVDRDDDVALLHADLSGGRAVGDRGDDDALADPLKRQFLHHRRRQVHHLGAVEGRTALDGQRVPRRDFRSGGELQRQVEGSARSSGPRAGPSLRAA